MTVKTIAILGAGQMGGGIAQVCALAGLRADLHDSNPDQLARAVESVSRRIFRLAEKGATPKEHAAEAVKRIFPQPETGKWLENADFAVEAVAENAEIKRAVLRQARSRLRKDAVLATNTSSISITELAAGLSHPENFIGMHFMNPVPMMPLVEVIPGADTSAETVARVESLARELGKTSARAADYPGFITNRILMPMLNEAFFRPDGKHRRPGGHRPLHEAWHAPSDGAAGVGRLYRAGHLPGGFAGDAPGIWRPQVPPLSAAGENGCRRTAGEEKRRGILRLPRRTAGSGGDFISEPMTEAPKPTAPDEDALLTARGISLSFGGLRALKDVSFSIRRREFFSIIGPNGAGKTSLLNCLSGRYRPQAGTMTYGGEDLFARSINARAKMGVSRTFQNLALFDHMSALDNILVGRHHLMGDGFLRGALFWVGGAREEEIRHRAEVEDIIDFLEIQSVRHTPAGALPYGMRKRVELARAIAVRPRLLLLDEPMAGMNLDEKEDMARFIVELNEEWGITVVMIEHDMGVVMDISERVMALDFGEVAAIGTPG